MNGMYAKDTTVSVERSKAEIEAKVRALLPGFK